MHALIDNIGFSMQRPATGLYVAFQIMVQTLTQEYAYTPVGRVCLQPGVCPAINPGSTDHIRWLIYVMGQGCDVGNTPSTMLVSGTAGGEWKHISNIVPIQLNVLYDVEFVYGLEVGGLLTVRDAAGNTTHRVAAGGDAIPYQGALKFLSEATVRVNDIVVAGRTGGFHARMTDGVIRNVVVHDNGTDFTCMYALYL